MPLIPIDNIPWRNPITDKLEASFKHLDWLFDLNERSVVTLKFTESMKRELEEAYKAIKYFYEYSSQWIAPDSMHFRRITTILKTLQMFAPELASDFLNLLKEKCLNSPLVSQQRIDTWCDAARACRVKKPIGTTFTDKDRTRLDLWITQTKWFTAKNKQAHFDKIRQFLVTLVHSRAGMKVAQKVCDMIITAHSKNLEFQTTTANALHEWRSACGIKN